MLSICLEFLQSLIENKLPYFKDIWNTISHIFCTKRYTISHIFCTKHEKVYKPLKLLVGNPNWLFHTNSYFLCEYSTIITYRALLHIDCAYAEETHNKFFKWNEKKSPKWQNQCVLQLQSPKFLRVHCAKPYSNDFLVKTKKNS